LYVVEVRFDPALHVVDQLVDQLVEPDGLDDGHIRAKKSLATPTGV